MTEKDKAFLDHLLVTFRTEAEDHLRSITSGLLELEKKLPPDKKSAILEVAYRSAHSFKGAARAVNLNDIEMVCQSLEGIFASLKRQEISYTPELFDSLHSAVDVISKMLLSPEEERRTLTMELIRQLDSLQPAGSEAGVPAGEKGPADSERLHASGKVQKKAARQAPARPDAVGQDAAPQAVQSAPLETVRVSVIRLVSLLLEAEELLFPKLTINQHVGDIRKLRSMLEAWRHESAKAKAQMKKRPAGTAVSVQEFLEYLDRTDMHLREIEHRVAVMAKSVEAGSYSLDRTIHNLIGDMKEALMLPFSAILGILPKMVRDISREQGKEAELQLEGGEVQIDKRILEDMKDPLIHLVRNCLDHGIEKPEERLQKKKPRGGALKIIISRESADKVRMLVSDDGAGIAVDKVLKAAVKNAVISAEDAEKLSRQDALALIFHSGVSTSPIITDLSGRGLGLAIVQEKVEKFGGKVSVETGPDAGTSFMLLLPSSIAAFRGLLIRAEDQSFIVPLAKVERVLRIRPDEIKTVENKEAISLNGRAVSLVRLSQVLGLPHKVRRQDRKDSSPEFIPVIILNAADRQVGFSVDAVINEQEVLVKDLGSQLSRLRHVAGATIIGTGRVVPILDVNGLITSAAKTAAAHAHAAEKPGETEAGRKHVLVAEDSITSRMLLRNILEAAGYYVRTAVDGADAFAVLKTEDFDLVVSDVEMPRLNGFELTEKIRSDSRLAEMPVVLVTALDSRDDRERGIDAGANAYIVKSSFDQSNLLDVVKRLL